MEMSKREMRVCGEWAKTCNNTYSLKGHSTPFTHKGQFTYHGEYYSAEHSCLMSSEAQEELRQVWLNNPDDVIVMSSGLSQLVLGDDTFLAEGLL